MDQNDCKEGYSAQGVNLLLVAQGRVFIGEGVLVRAGAFLFVCIYLDIVNIH